MIFYAGRFSLLPIKKNIYYQQGNENKFSIVLQLLSKHIEFYIRKDTNLIIEPILDDDGHLLGGKIGRESTRKLPLSPNLAKVKTKMYPFILFIVDESEQVIFFERDYQVFSDDLVVFKYLLNYINKKLLTKGIVADIKPLSTKGRFWELVSEMDKIYSVRFIFKAPNFIGESYEELKDVLNKEKNDANANQIEYALNNDNGELNLAQNDRYKAAVGWAEDGAGEWLLRGKVKGRGKRRKTYRNYEQITTFDIDVNSDLETKSMIRAIKRRIDLGPHRIKGEKNVKN